MKSMTGFGKSAVEADGRTLVTEIKSVNNRFLDINSKMPRALSFLEDALRKKIQRYVSRGRVDVYLTYTDNSQSQREVSIDSGLAAGYVSAARMLSERFNLTNDFGVTALIKQPDVIKAAVPADDEDALAKLLDSGLQEALERLDTMRMREGEALRADVEQRADEIERVLELVAVRAPEVSRELGQKLEARVKELLSGVAVDESKLLNEVAFIADRVSIDEELSRLKSHISQLRGMLKENGQGRKLDFIIQEFNREANTICSKSNDALVTQYGLVLKSEIEKIREQVQNIE